MAGPSRAERLERLASNLENLAGASLLLDMAVSDGDHFFVPDVLRMILRYSELAAGHALALLEGYTSGSGPDGAGGGGG